MDSSTRPFLPVQLSQGSERMYSTWNLTHKHNTHIHTLRMYKDWGLDVAEEFIKLKIRCFSLPYSKCVQPKSTVYIHTTTHVPSVCHILPPLHTSHVFHWILLSKLNRHDKTECERNSWQEGKGSDFSQRLLGTGLPKVCSKLYVIDFFIVKYLIFTSTVADDPTACDKLFSLMSLNIHSRLTPSSPLWGGSGLAGRVTNSTTPYVPKK